MERKALERLEPGLPARWYHDPAHHARELEAFWYRRWIAVAREEELAAPGDWRLVRIGTQSLVVLRREQGELAAFHNTCRHRGSVLCTGERGNFARRRIVCPYHSWTYDLDAKLAEMGDDARLTLGPLDMSQFIPGMRVAWIADPEGNIVELNQGYVDEAEPLPLPA